MFDTVYIDIPWQNLEGLHRKSETIDSETGQVISSVGYKDCIKIKKVNGMMRIECSLSKLLKGNNIYCLNYHETLEALIRIEQLLDISIKKGIIRRIDFGVTIETNYKPQDYFKYFGPSNYFHRSLTGKSSLYYKNGNRQKYFYDKIKEVKSNRGCIPIEFDNKNLFRYECRYGNQFIASKFGSLSVQKFMSKETFMQFAEIALFEYNSIQKVNIIVFDGLKISSKSKFFEQLASMMVNVLGLNEVLEMIDATKVLYSCIPKEYYSRRKSEIKKLAQQSQTTKKTNLIKELNEKIELRIAKLSCIE